MAEPLIRTVNLSKDYRTDAATVHALRHVDLTVQSGEFVAVTGPSGSGKSTLLNMLGLLDRPSNGAYYLDGQDVTALEPDQAALLRNTRIGFVFQGFNLLARSTAIENVEVPLIYSRVDKRERQRLAARALDAVGLGDRASHWPQQLSGGEQQRVAIARALVVDPLLILADEPTGAIDSRTGTEIMALFQQLHEQGRSIVLVTHNPTVAQYAGRMITMKDGGIAVDATVPAQLEVETASQRSAEIHPPTRAPRDENGANIAESFRVALRALRVNVMRSALTMLGIIIGVAALITIVAIASGANLQIAEQIRSLGTNLLLIQPGTASSGAVRLGAGTAMSLTEEDALAIVTEVAGVQVAAPLVADNANLIRGNRNWSALVGGITPEYLIARAWRLSEGRSFSLDEVSSAARVVLLGSTSAERLFADEDPIGQAIRIANVPFTVIGVLSDKGQDPASGRDQDDVALIPLSTAKLRVSGRYAQLNRSAVDYVLVKVANGMAMDSVTTQITSLLRQRHRISRDGEDDFAVTDPAAAMQFRASATRSLSLLLVAISSVSLVVGGISIMNIMLVSVTERTREIGIRLAVGARRRDLWGQFLIEAITLCVLGGLVGILLGTGAAVGIAQIAGWPIYVTPVAVLVAVAFAAMVGVFFGFYPALKASRLHPIEALRFE